MYLPIKPFGFICFFQNIMDLGYFSAQYSFPLEKWSIPTWCDCHSHSPSSPVTGMGSRPTDRTMCPTYLDAEVASGIGT